MTLQPCRECGKETSTEATTCPGCGVPNPTGSSAALLLDTAEQGTRSLGKSVITILFVIWTAFFAWAGLAGLAEVGESTGGTMSDAEAVGAMIGLFLLAVVWLVGALGLYLIRRFLCG